MVESDAPGSSFDREPDPSVLTVANLVYGLHAFAIVVGLAGSATVVGTFVWSLPSILAVVLNYAKRADARGTWVESHFRWQIRTFWYALRVVLGRAVPLRDRDRHSRRARRLPRPDRMAHLPHRARLAAPARPASDVHHPMTEEPWRSRKARRHPRSRCRTRKGKTVSLADFDGQERRSSTSTRRTTRPAAPRRPAASATPGSELQKLGAVVLGVSPDGGRLAPEVPRQVQAPVHAALRPGPQGDDEVRRLRREDDVREEDDGRDPLDRLDRARRQGAQALGARREGRGPPGRRCSRRCARARRRRRSAAEARSSRSLPQEGGERRQERVELVVVHPVAGARDVHEARVAEGGGAPVEHRIAGPALRAAHEQRRAGDARPERARGPRSRGRAARGART